MSSQKQINNDDLLLEQIQSGEKESFNLLFDKYWETAVNTVYKRIKDLEASKDIVQEIFTRIWINRETPIGNFPAYLNTSTRNSVIKYYLRKESLVPFFDDLEELSEKYQADTILRWKELKRSVEEAIELLPPKRKEILKMRVEDDLSTKTIAEELGVARKTVQNQLGKALDTLKINIIRLLTSVLLLSYLLR